MDVISNFAARFERSREEEISIEDYLAECKRNPVAYATAAERMPRRSANRRWSTRAMTRGCRACSRTS